MAVPWDAIASGASGLIGNLMNIGAARKNRQMQIQLNRENNQFNAEQSQIQRDWTERMYTDYQSPQALRNQYQEAGFNPYLAMSQGAGSVGSSSAAQAAGTPTLQAPQLDVSSIGDMMASVAQAIKISKEASYVEPTSLENLNYLRAQGAKLEGDTNWLNRFGKNMRSSPELQNLSESFIRKQATGEIERIDLANDLLGQQKVLLNLDAQAKRLSNYYYPKQVQQDLALKSAQISQTLSQVDLTKAQTTSERSRNELLIRQVATEMASMLNIMQDTKGKKMDNKVLEQTMWSYISASNSQNILSSKASQVDKQTYQQYRDAFVRSVKSQADLNEQQKEFLIKQGNNLLFNQGVSILDRFWDNTRSVNPRNGAPRRVMR